MMDHGAEVHWIGSANPVELDRDMANPVGAFLPGGTIVLVSDRQTMIFDVDSVGVQKVTRVELSTRVNGVISTGERRQFAALTGNEVVVYNVES
jgi:hypothetical protein